MACTSTGASTANVATGSGAVYSAFSSGAIITTGETICNGGDPATNTSSSVASGGDGSITYQWKKGSSVLASSPATFDPSISNGAGVYTREAKDGTCNTSFTASTGSWTVTARSAFSSGTISSSGETICNGGSFSEISSSSAASGGDGSISYTWHKDGGSAIGGATSITYTPTSAGTYTRKAADGTCNTSPTLSSGSYVATERSAFSSGTISSTGESFCSTGSPSNTISSTAGASGGDGSISYTWHKNGGGAIGGATSATYAPTTAGTYTRKAADGTCSTGGTTSSGSWVITSVSAPVAGTISGTAYTYRTGTTSLSISGNSASGSWTSSNDGIATVNSSGVVTGVADGSATITYTVSASPCSDATTTQDVNITDTWVTSVTHPTGSPGRYVGDYVNYTYQFEVDQSSWNDAGVGVGTDLNSLTWTSASWYADNGSNKRLQTSFANNSGYQFTAAGTHYMTGRIKKDAGDAYTYSDVTIGTWTNEVVLSSASCGYLTVSTLPDPASFTSANTNHNSTDLSWTKQAHSSGSGSYDVLVLRKTSAFDGSDVPSTGSSYSVGNTIGGATVVYKGNASTLDESSLSSGQTYYYKIHSENYGYYSSGASTTVNVLAAPSISTSGSIGSFTACSGVAGASDNFSVSGSNLTADITVTAPTGYEVSTDNSSFSSSVTLTQSGGSVSSTTVYVRLTSSASNSASGNVACTSTNASTQNVATGSGTVYSLFSTGAINTTGETICPGGDPSNITSSSAANGGNGTITYQWKLDGSVLSSSNSVTFDPSISNGAGAYTREAKDATCNTSFTASVGTWTISEDAAPSSQASSFTSSSIANTSATVGWTRGNGDEVIVVAKASSAPTTDPTNGTTYAADAAFGSGDALSGGYVVYKGTGTSVSITGLTASVTYHIAVYENETSNSCNLYNSTQLTGSFTTSVPTISTSGSIGSFTACSGVAGASDNFSVSGTNLTANIAVTAPTGYEVSTDNSSFSSSVTLTQSGGTVNSTTIYVRLTSSASNSASGNVACTSTGASTANVATGSGTVTSAPDAGTLSGTQTFVLMDHLHLVLMVIMVEHGQVELLE